MKRELKGLTVAASLTAEGVEESFPMKRELKETSCLSGPGRISGVEESFPMKRELKARTWACRPVRSRVEESFPMKRELKVDQHLRPATRLVG